MTIAIPRESAEKLSCTITADIDPTSLTVRFAFTRGDERPTTWTAGTWVGGAVVSGAGRWTANALTPLIGAGALDLEVGRYLVWVQLDGASEDPVIPAGELTIT